MDWKPYEPFLHRCMGFLAMLTNTRLLLTRREMKQLPPENDRYPVIFIVKYPRKSWVVHTDLGGDEYWSKARVMDTLNDSKQYDQGGSIGWFVLVGASMLLGAMLHRWLG